LVHFASSVNVNIQVIDGLAYLLVASYACLTAYWFVLLAHAYLIGSHLASFACQ
jgi:hypothetical protein